MTTDARTDQQDQGAGDVRAVLAQTIECEASRILATEGRASYDRYLRTVLETMFDQIEAQAREEGAPDPVAVADRAANDFARHMWARWYILARQAYREQEHHD